MIKALFTDQAVRMMLKKKKKSAIYTECKSDGSSDNAFSSSKGDTAPARARCCLTPAAAAAAAAEVGSRAPHSLPG